jgi:hypothetical protein
MRKAAECIGMDIIMVAARNLCPDIHDQQFTSRHDSVVVGVIKEIVKKRISYADGLGSSFLGGMLGGI